MLLASVQSIEDMCYCQRFICAQIHCMGHSKELSELVDPVAMPRLDPDTEAQKGMLDRF